MTEDNSLPNNESIIFLVDGEDGQGNHTVMRIALSKNESFELVAKLKLIADRKTPSYVRDILTAPNDMPVRAPRIKKKPF